ncbi:response regulator [Bordetella petrii]|nr:response regulator [Bordetella petrii]
MYKPSLPQPDAEPLQPAAAPPGPEVAISVQPTALAVQQSRLLELIATGASLQDSLVALTATAAELDPDVRAGVLLAAPDGMVLEQLYTAHLPAAFAEAVLGTPIDDSHFGTCGTAVRQGARIYCADIDQDPQWSSQWRSQCLAAGLQACLSTPIFDAGGKAVGSFFMGLTRSGRNWTHLLALADFGARLAGIAIANARAAADAQRARRELEEELADTRRLQEIGMRLLASGHDDSLYSEIAEAAAAIMEAEYASMQILHRDRGCGGELHLLASKGFPPEAKIFWEWVTVQSHSTCGEALRTRARVFVSDVRECGFMACTDDLATYRGMGILAVQTTPLISRRGHVIGMISTHWREPRQPCEHELRHLDLLARQAADLVDQRLIEQDLKEADRQKDQFLAQLAHELRNPLAPIRNIAELLGRKSAQDPTLREPGAVILRQIDHFSRLIDDLLDVGRIGHGHLGLKKESTTLTTVLQHAMETSASPVNAKGQQVVLGLPAAPVPLEGDPVRLAQVFANLIINGSKYSEPGGRIIIEAELDHPGHVMVRVRDQGIGIDRKDLGSLFKLFYQVEQSLEHSRGGLGIGLFLVQRLVELHEGTVEVFSEGLGHGAEFRVRLPLRESLTGTSGNTADMADKPPAGRGLNVLLADDNQDAAQTLAAILELDGHRVILAADGEDALAAARLHRPDVAILDIGMPKLDGYTVCTRLRGEPWAGSLKIIAMSGYGASSDIARSAQTGFDRHFTKPADLNELLGFLASL